MKLRKTILLSFLSILNAAALDAEKDELALSAEPTLILECLDVRGKLSMEEEEYIPSFFCGLLDEGVPPGRIMETCLNIVHKKTLNLWNPIKEKSPPRRFREEVMFSYRKNTDGDTVLVLFHPAGEFPLVEELETPIYSFKKVLSLPLPVLDEIIITSVGLKEFPSILMQQPFLKVLNLYNNKIVKVPEEIDQLASLKKLILASNTIKTIPKNITNLKFLEYLDLSNNQLKLLPVSMYKMALKYIDVRGNWIEGEPIFLEIIRRKKGKAYWDCQEKPTH